LINLVTQKSHQLFLSECEVNFSDLRFMQVLYNKDTQRYTLTTLHKDKRKESADPEMVIYTLHYQFTQGIKELFTNLRHGRVNVN